MSAKTTTCIIAVLLIAPLLAQNPESDVLKDAVDPYNPGRERDRFSKAAGVDSVLEQSEFEASSNAKDGFVRPYDKWANIKAFDRDNDGKIDLQEMAEYRRALRKAVIAKYAKDSKALTPEEHQLASRDLAAGKVPTLDAKASPSSPATASTPRGRGGFGPGGGRFANMSPEERRAAQLAEGRESYKRMVAQHDKDGDGRLSESEIAAMPLREQFEARAINLALRHFDENGDGQIDEQELKNIEEFGAKLRQSFEPWRNKIADLNGDGVVSPEEEQQVRQTFQAAAFQLMPKIQQWVGDIQSSPAAQQEVAQRVARAAQQKVEEWTKKFDANGDGKLDPNERDALIKGINDDLAARIQKHAAADGRPDAAGWATIAEELAAEWGIKPASAQ